MTERDIIPDQSSVRIVPDRSTSAFIGAAVGDALGWPHEMRASNVDKRSQARQLRFERWTKRSGGRFQPHEEIIEPGHYSDDTQLILACARSLVSEPASWWISFATKELPIWTLYQRGGGGATKRAASSWLSGRAPWDTKRQDYDRYFQAGGNGVAMRILPHCVRHADAEAFTEVAVDIVTDGVVTHGHPRALVGALAYGYGLWRALKVRGTLAYGELVDVVANDISVWGGLPYIGDRWPGWLDAAQQSGDYRRIWSDTVREQAELFRRCAEGLAGGVATIEEDVLAQLGAFDRATNGSGTVNAAAALFLASRNAADPLEALRQSALATGADTDTLASMTGGLLGAALGDEWLSRFAPELQDVEAIRKSAAAVRSLAVQLQARDLSDPIGPVTKAALKIFVGTLETTSSSSVELPNGVAAKVGDWDGVVSKSPSLLARSWRLTLQDGQTIFVKKLTKVHPQTMMEASDATVAARDEAMSVPEPLHVGIRLAVSDIARSAVFYQEVLGLAVGKRTNRSISFGAILSLTEGSAPPSPSAGVTVYLEVPRLELNLAAYRRLYPTGECRVDERADRKRMQCMDPDGHLLEIWEIKRNRSE